MSLRLPVELIQLSYEVLDGFGINGSAVVGQGHSVMFLVIRHDPNIDKHGNVRMVEGEIEIADSVCGDGRKRVVVRSDCDFVSEIRKCEFIMRLQKYQCVAARGATENMEQLIDLVIVVHNRHLRPLESAD
jgi:hypothetical protein